MKAKETINIKACGLSMKEAKKTNSEMLKFLEPLKKAGVLDFSILLKRKCDFCGKTIEEGEKFKHIDEHTDKCMECQKNKNGK